MSPTFFRRYRMEFDLRQVEIEDPILPDGYRWVPWEEGVLASHARAKFESFHDELDSRVFRSLSHYDGCLRLMSEIAGHSQFIPSATWLVEFSPDPTLARHPCATIQGIQRGPTLGAIQNVGVIPEHRGLGLGRAIVLRCLLGFRAAGLERVYLEVTAENEPAVELYRSVGFSLIRTRYKVVEEPVQHR